MPKGVQQGVEHYQSQIQTLRKLSEELSHARTNEQVYALSLNTIRELFRPDQAFVSLSQPQNSKLPVNPPLNGWLSDVAIPIHAGDELVGKFILQYGPARNFSEADITMMRLIALQCGAYIHFFNKEQQKTVAASEQHESRNELIAMALHELRSPLTAILGATTILQSDDEQACARALEMIRRNVRSQLRLIDDLLQAAQCHSGKMEIEFSEIDLACVLHRTIEDIGLTVQNGTIIRSEIRQPLPVRGDEQRLLQIFTNLLANSLRFAPPNGEVQVRAEIRDGSVTVVIRDNGVGIDAADLPRIFELFHQGHSVAARGRRGFGLGLAIVKDLVALHGGSIEAQSAGPNQGATFIVRIPAAS